MEEERLISLNEAAARSRLSTGFLRRLCRTGKIRAVKVGRDWVTTWQAVAEYLEDAEKRSKNPFKYRDS
ncbi:MAG: helix-turn-helix domain-containing protein [Chloroflexota bacterium]